MAKQKPKRRPRKKDKWRPTPLTPVPRTEGELRAYAEWQAHKRELEVERRVARDAHDNAFRTALKNYLNDAGLLATLSGDEIRTGDGFPFRVTSGERRRGDAAAAFDRLVATRFREVLLDRVAEHLSGIGFALHARSSPEGVRLTRSGDPQATVNASRAVVDGISEPLRGNFLAGGDHWHALRTALRRRSLTQLLVELPPWMSETDVNRAIHDSDRLRLERTLEFGHPVVLERPDCSLRFAPIALNGNAIEVPFRYQSDAKYLEGALRLKTPRAPLAILVTDRSDHEGVVGEAWTIALRGYAELTCTSDMPDTDRRVRAVALPSHQQPRHAPDVRARSVRGAGGASKAWTLSTTLEPTRSTRVLLASYVVGHRRRLPPDHRPSDEAREHAKRIGIALSHSETWVKPHARGIPPDAELVFAWRD